MNAQLANTSANTSANPESPDNNAAPLAEIAQLCESRAGTYGLLARLYRKEVDTALLEQLHATRFPAATGNAAMDEGYRLIATYLSNAWENTLEELAVDYTRAFIGNGVDAFSAAYPFESVYTSEKRLMMQDARDEVLAIYRSYGLDKTSEWKEGEDHIALEMEFLQTLALRCAQALRAGDEDVATSLLLTQRNFLEDHLAAWAPMFTADVTRCAESGFYHGIARLTDGFIEVDSEFLEEICAGAENENEGEAEAKNKSDN